MDIYIGDYDTDRMKREIMDKGITINQYKGYLSVLDKKGYIHIDQTDRDEEGKPMIYVLLDKPITNKESIVSLDWNRDIKGI
jgi:hypothetical protein